MDIKEKISLFPHSPGVYRYYDSEGKIIYVGKAKDLHKRVAQYFVAPERLNTKTRILVSKIADAQYSVVATEADALLLENNLIKQYKPRYNILLKDSKTYPWICITAEEFPRVFLTRTLRRDGSRHFGPYSFEQAAVFKEKMERLGNHYSKSVITAASDADADVFSLLCDAGEAFGNFMRVRGGAIVQSVNLGFKMNIEEEPAAILSEFIAEIQAKFGKLAKEVVVPFLPDVEMPGIAFKIPAKGDKLAILELSARNAREFRANNLRQKEKANPDEYRTKVLEDLKKALDMPVLPEHMECFDNSNIQGTNPVASCVVFRGGVPSKKDYRRFKIKTVIGANDYASMKEVVNRRYSRMLEEAPEDLPQLVVIDGGKGQLDFAYQALQELGLTEKLTVIGLAKRLEEVIRVGDPYPLFIDRDSLALKVLQQIRDEAHRFGITFHRSLRSKTQIDSALRSIKGVGEKLEQRLLMHYGSVARIAAAPQEDLAAFLGNAPLAQRIKNSLQ